MDIVEHWLPVVGYEGHYSVSDQGRVRSEHRVTISQKGNRRTIRERILLPAPAILGHLNVVLYINQRKTSKYVHHLVMEAFVGPRPSNLDIRHLNGNAEDNRLSNLAYGTRKENVRDTLRHGTNRNASKTHCKWGHEFTLENTYWDPTDCGRRCRACRAERRRAHEARKAATRLIPIPRA